MSPKATTKKLPVVRTAIVLDPIGWSGATPDEERDQILEELRENDLEPKLVHYGHNPLDLPETQIDLLVVDYGALWQQGMGDWTRHLLRYAEDHPNSLIVVWTTMTVDLFVSELTPFNDATGWYEKATLPPNLVALHPGNSSPTRSGIDWDRYGDSVDWLDHSWNQIRSWFDAPDPAPKPKLKAPR